MEKLARGSLHKILLESLKYLKKDEVVLYISVDRESKELVLLKPKQKTPLFEKNAVDVLEDTEKLFVIHSHEGVPYPSFNDILCVGDSILLLYIISSREKFRNAFLLFKYNKDIEYTLKNIFEGYLGMIVIEEEGMKFLRGRGLKYLIKESEKIARDVAEKEIRVLLSLRESGGQDSLFNYSLDDIVDHMKKLRRYPIDIIEDVAGKIIGKRRSSKLINLLSKIYKKIKKFAGE